MQEIFHAAHVCLHLHHAAGATQCQHAGRFEVQFNVSFSIRYLKCYVLIQKVMLQYFDGTLSQAVLKWQAVTCTDRL